MADPVLVYDDDCGFCTWWAEFFDERSEIPIVGFSALTPALRDRLPADYEDCSHLVTDDRVYSCGESIEEALVRADLAVPTGPAIQRLRGFGPYNAAREWGYRWVAHNRGRLGRFLSKPTDRE
jgi:predicted DCC family thiol-disulfide oxidoreductase YuxK